MEAKVLEKPSDVTRYLSDLTEKYLTGKGAALSDTAALVGYLRQGAANDVFANLEKRLGQPLQPNTRFADRPHRTTHHERHSSVLDSQSPFTCHHLILALS